MSNLNNEICRSLSLLTHVINIIIIIRTTAIYVCVQQQHQQQHVMVGNVVRPIVVLRLRKVIFFSSVMRFSWIRLVSLYKMYTLLNGKTHSHHTLSTTQLCWQRKYRCTIAPKHLVNTCAIYMWLHNDSRQSMELTIPYKW